MTDWLPKKTRSKIMSSIRSKRTKPEMKVHGYLKSRKIRHKMNPKIDGSPDIILKDSKRAIFIHGCFWHKCTKCFKKPQSNTEYWDSKIERNVKRDKKNKRILEKNGWAVAIIWEHELKKDFEKNIKKLLKLGKNKSS